MTIFLSLLCSHSATCLNQWLHSPELVFSKSPMSFSCFLYIRSCIWIYLDTLTNMVKKMKCYWEHRNFLLSLYFEMETNIMTLYPWFLYCWRRISSNINWLMYAIFKLELSINCKNWMYKNPMFLEYEVQILENLSKLASWLMNGFMNDFVLDWQKVE